MIQVGKDAADALVVHADICTDLGVTLRAPFVRETVLDNKIVSTEDVGLAESDDKHSVVEVGEVSELAVAFVRVDHTLCIVAEDWVSRSDRSDNWTVAQCIRKSLRCRLNLFVVDKLVIVNVFFNFVLFSTLREELTTNTRLVSAHVHLTLVRRDFSGEDWVVHIADVVPGRLEVATVTVKVRLCGRAGARRAVHHLLHGQIGLLTGLKRHGGFDCANHSEGIR